MYTLNQNSMLIPSNSIFLGIPANGFHHKCISDYPGDSRTGHPPQNLPCQDSGSDAHSRACAAAEHWQTDKAEISRNHRTSHMTLSSTPGSGNDEMGFEIWSTIQLGNDLKGTISAGLGKKDLGKDSSTSVVLLISVFPQTTGCPSKKRI
jgi:hypothetical protein